MYVMQRRSGQLILLLYLVAKIFLTYKKPLNILHTTKRKFLSIKKKAIQINFNEAELDRLKAKADAQCLRLQDYIRKILSAYG